MSEHAVRSRRVTTASDVQRAMREQQAQKEMGVGPSKYELQGPTV
jgi:hypothetical protein